VRGLEDGESGRQMDMVNKTGAPILRVKNVSKTFGGSVCALDDVGLEVYPNEIVGVVGENGAGKTTLMKILVGVHAPDQGEWEHNGVVVPFPRNPKEAARKGISIVYQERGVIPSLKVYQFLFLGNEEKYERKWGLQIGKMKKYAREILDEFHVQCGIDDFMYDLHLSTQKMVEITKAVLRIRLEQDKETTDSVIILDEPTAPLTIEERRELLGEILRMKSNTSFVYVTHIMQEVMEYMDEVVVLRDGKRVGYFDMSVQRATEDDLAKAIVGKDASAQAYERAPHAVKEGEIVLSAKNLTTNGCYYDISFDLHRGECIGLFGPAGSGKSEIIKSIAGLRSHDSGTLMLQGCEARPKEPAHKRLSRGVGYFSGDTANELLHDWPISKNISILNINKVVGKFLHFLRFKAEKALAARIVEQLRIRTPGVTTLISSLSGGSKQKVTVGRWFERNPAILLMEDPTIGIDVGSREDIYQAILSMKRGGMSMILVSDDMKEYSTLCDGILLMKQGRATEHISAERLNEVLST
jgi:ribose transport system ATP-binding protein